MSDAPESEEPTVHATVSMEIPMSEVQLLVDLVGAVGVTFNHDYDTNKVHAYIIREHHPDYIKTFIPNVETIDVPLGPVHGLLSRGMLIPSMTSQNLPQFDEYHFQDDRRGATYHFRLNDLGEELAQGLRADVLAGNRNPGSYMDPEEA